MAESKETGKPVFLYVATVRGTFMDRKPVVDRYMRASFFSWPDIIDLLNTRFVPVQEAPGRKLAKELDLVPYKFVEPGFLILNPEGSRLGFMDQITTFQPRWLFQQVAAFLDQPPAMPVHKDTQLAAAWEKIGRGDIPTDLFQVEADDPHAAEKLLCNGICVFKTGAHDQAKEIWQQAAVLQPSHPLAWKALAEAEGWGPYVRGFETFRTLPDSLSTSTRHTARGSAAGDDVFVEREVWERSVDFLLQMQNKNGGWLDSDYDFGGTDGLPNVYVAVTSLCGMALMDARDRVPSKRQEIDDAINRAAAFVVDESQINRSDSDEILWAFAYRVRFLAKLIKQNGRENSPYTDPLQRAVGDLEQIQTKRGSWYHEYANPFVTATALAALKDAADVQITLDQEKLKQGIESLARDRFANGAFPYSSRSRPARPDSAPREGDLNGSAGRMPLCELALLRWNHSSDERLAKAVEHATENNGFLEVGYKYDNHTSTHAYGGFFYWYDIRSRAEAIGHIASTSLRQQRANEARQHILRKPEIDGCFVDSHELGRCYGTAMALLSLGCLDGANASE